MWLQTCHVTGACLLGRRHCAVGMTIIITHSPVMTWLPWRDGVRQLTSPQGWPQALQGAAAHRRITTHLNARQLLYKLNVAYEVATGPEHCRELASPEIQLCLQGWCFSHTCSSLQAVVGFVVMARLQYHCQMVGVGALQSLLSSLHSHLWSAWYLGTQGRVALQLCWECCVGLPLWVPSHAACFLHNHVTHALAKQAFTLDANRTLRKKRCHTHRNRA